jgi:hypothetical protein
VSQLKWTLSGDAVALTFAAVFPTEVTVVEATEWPRLLFQHQGVRLLAYVPQDALARIPVRRTPVFARVEEVSNNASPSPNTLTIAPGIELELLRETAAAVEVFYRDEAFSFRGFIPKEVLGTVFTPMAPEVSEREVTTVIQAGPLLVAPVRGAQSLGRIEARAASGVVRRGPKLPGGFQAVTYQRVVYVHAHDAKVHPRWLFTAKGYLHDSQLGPNAPKSTQTIGSGFAALSSSAHWQVIVAGTCLHATPGGLVVGIVVENTAMRFGETRAQWQEIEAQTPWGEVPVWIEVPR